MITQRRYAQDQVLALSEQATELHKLSTQLVQSAPWSIFLRMAGRG
jgi:hypothetical protein